MISLPPKLSTFLSEKVNSSTWREDFRAFFMARHCLLCLQTHHHASGLCEPCLTDLPWLQTGCDCCGVQLPAECGSRRCAACILKRPAFDRCLGLFDYDFPVREMVMDLKFHGKLHFALPLAHLLSQHYRLHSQFQRHDLILAPPLHPRRLRQRGYNQAMELARLFSRRCRVPLAADLVEKIKETPAQSGLSAQERARNLKGCFRLKGDVTSKSLLLIDDIVTTGHTAGELAKLLKHAGATRVDVLCIARTPPPSA